MYLAEVYLDRRGLGTNMYARYHPATWLTLATLVPGRKGEFWFSRRIIDEVWSLLSERTLKGLSFSLRVE